MLENYFITSLLIGTTEMRRALPNYHAPSVTCFFRDSVLILIISVPKVPLALRNCTSLEFENDHLHWTYLLCYDNVEFNSFI